MPTEELLIDHSRYEGRPSQPRSAEEDSCYDLLERLSIPFFRVDHSPAGTIALCHAVEAVLGTDICKNLFLCNRQGTEFYLLLLRGDKPFKTKYLSRQLGVSRLSFADGADMERLLGVQPGNATVLGLKNDVDRVVRLVIDRSVLETERFACHPCVNTSTVSFLTADLIGKLLPALGHTPTMVDLPEEEEDG
ncbi:MAG: prolyl-tRNA synthetase associated domain-containing protein [Faecousia sp.]